LRPKSLRILALEYSNFDGARNLRLRVYESSSLRQDALARAPLKMFLRKLSCLDDEKHLI
jgi:hypothetical protein